MVGFVWLASQYDVMQESKQNSVSSYDLILWPLQLEINVSELIDSIAAVNTARVSGLFQSWTRVSVTFFVTRPDP